MTPEDAEIIRSVRREMNKRPMDISRVDIQTGKGHVVLAGTIATPRDQPNVDLAFEIGMLTKQLMRDSMIRSVRSEMRLVVPEKKEEGKDDARGRMRHGAH